MMSVTTSSNDSRQLQRRFDVRVETSAFEARPVFIWAFQRSKEQLQAIFTQRTSLLCRLQVNSSISMDIALR